MDFEDNYVSINHVICNGDCHFLSVPLTITMTLLLYSTSEVIILFLINVLWKEADAGYTTRFVLIIYEDASELKLKRIEIELNEQ